LVTGASLAGDLHLQPSSQIHQGVETPLEMLNRTEAFFVLSLADGTVRLVAKDQTVAVSFGAGSPDTEVGDMPGATALRMEVLMVDGREYAGEVWAILPPRRSRIIDLLNLPERFFSLAADGMIHYLNRSHVLHVRPLD
jgi:hypothetical protein